MNAVAGAAGAGQDSLTIRVALADARVCAVRISSTRATHLSRLFIGRPAQEAPLLAQRIFALCGVSHRLVAARAIASARGEPISAHRNRVETTALLAERLCAALRSNMILAVQTGAGVINSDLIRTVSELLSLARELYCEALACSARESLDCGTTRSLIGEICARGRNLSLREPRGAASRFAFEHLEKEFAGSESFAVIAPDPLRDADDDEVLQGIRDKGASFAANPSLDGRAPETGAFARFWLRTDLSKGALAARFEARMIDIAECFAELEASETDARMFQAFSPSPREGLAAAETSRGRLHHWTRLSAEDRIEDHQIVAPTEWNFHPAGPFIEALLGATMEPGRAERRIAQFAGLFDPCVPFRVEVREHDRA
ncbi:MAG: nickel-dependent hydrogenase large subunit [Methylocystis sp.]